MAKDPTGSTALKAEPLPTGTKAPFDDREAGICTAGADDDAMADTEAAGASSDASEAGMEDTCATAAVTPAEGIITI